MILQTLKRIPITPQNSKIYPFIGAFTNQNFWFWERSFKKKKIEGNSTDKWHPEYIYQSELTPNGVETQPKSSLDSDPSSSKPFQEGYRKTCPVISSFSDPLFTSSIIHQSNGHTFYYSLLDSMTNVYLSFISKSLNIVPMIIIIFPSLLQTKI